MSGITCRADRVSGCTPLGGGGGEDTRRSSAQRAGSWRSGKRPGLGSLPLTMLESVVSSKVTYRALLRSRRGWAPGPVSRHTSHALFRMMSSETPGQAGSPTRVANRRHHPTGEHIGPERIGRSGVTHFVIEGLLQRRRLPICPVRSGIGSTGAVTGPEGGPVGPPPWRQRRER